MAQLRRRLSRYLTDVYIRNACEFGRSTSPIPSLRVAGLFRHHRRLTFVRGIQSIAARCVGTAGCRSMKQLSDLLTVKAIEVAGQEKHSTWSGKRKSEHVGDQHETSSTGQKISKEERRDAKRARRAMNRNEQENDNHHSTDPEVAVREETNVPPPGHEDMVTLGKSAEEDLAKPERRKKKSKESRKAQSTSFTTGTQGAKEEIAETMENEAKNRVNSSKDMDKTAAKAVRKAEKARKISEARRNILSGTFPDGMVAGQDVKSANGEGALRNRDVPIDPTEEISGIVRSATDSVADAVGVRKAEKETKKRLKALKKAQSGEKSNTLPMTMSNGVSRHSASSAENTIYLTSTYVEDPDLSNLSETEVDAFLSSNFISITDPSSTTPLRPIIMFSHLPKAAITSPSPFAGFKAPTPIQSAAWPFLLSKRDVIGVAETGSGKTLAFGVPCIRSILSSPSFSSGRKTKAKAGPVSAARAVIVSPTRELAVQIHEQLEKLASPAKLSTACIYGGVPKDPQRQALATAHIIVATPGRLNDLIEEGAADLSQVNYLVLDEADRMLDKGFEAAIRTIIQCTPSTSSGRQTLMFTATWPPSVRELAATFMHQPVHISIGENNPSGELRANARITQKVEVLEPEAKQFRLLQIIKQHQGGSKNKNDRILVFCLYKKEAVRIEGYLHSKGLRVAGIHGDLNQERRMASLEAFKSGNCPLLVATDVAARGLDIPAVKLVLNVTFPLTVEDYVHRIGRYVSLSSPLLYHLCPLHHTALPPALFLRSPK